MAARLTAYVVVAIVAATLIAGLIVGAQRDDNDGPVDLIVRNAAVYTADRRGTTAEAVAIRGNQILRVGSDREIARLQRPQTLVVDARGGTVLPGFNDAHLNLIEGGLRLGTIDLTSAGSVAAILERVQSWSAANPTAAWIVGSGWSADDLKGTPPTRQLLDSVVKDRPVLLYSADERAAWVNSQALRMARITRRTADPDGGTIVRESRAGEPSGSLIGSAAALVASSIPAASREQRADALRAAMAHANAFGVTSVQSLGETADALELYDALRRSGDLTLRVYSALRVDRPIVEGDLARLDEIRKRFPDDPLVKAGALYFDLDGAVTSRAAAMLEPYEGSTDAGGLAFDPDDLNRSARLADAAGWQLVTEANGDRAVRVALNAYAHAVRSNRPDRRGRRHRIDGIGLVDAEDVERFGTLGVLASMQPLRAPWAERLDLLSPLVGTERAGRSLPFSSVAGSARLVLGSAWPAHVLDPLEVIQSATGTPPPEAVPAPDTLPNPDEPALERLKLDPALDAYTSAPAWASFDDQRKGSISPGMLADLVVLTGDIRSLPPARLGTVGVAVTIFDGKIVYERTPRAETVPAPSLQH